MQQDTIDQLLDAGIAAQSAGDLAGAERSYRAALELNPREPDALHLLGTVCHQLGRGEDALKLLAEAVALAPDAAMFHFNFGEALRSSGAYEDALGHYREAMALEPEMKMGAVPQMECLAWLGKKEEALAMFAGALASARTVQEMLRVARAAETAGSTTQAIEATRQALARMPNHAEALDVITNLYRKSMRHSELMPIFKRLVETEPSAGHYLSLATAYADCAEYAAGEETARRCLELYPDAVDAHFIRGFCAQQMSDGVGAAGHYARSVQSKPDHIPSLMSLATMLRGTGRPLEAIEIYEKVRALQPEEAGVYYSLAFTYESIGRPKESIEMARKALAIDPEHGASIRLLAMGLQKGRQSREAEALVLKYLEKNPEDTRAFEILGSLYLDRGDLAQATAFFRKHENRVHPENGLSSNVLLCATYDDAITPRELLDMHVEWGKRQPALKSLPPAIGSRKPGKIRVGYVSADLRMHSVAFFVCPVLMFHDKSKFDVYCYANLQYSDSVTQMFQSLGHTWRQITGVSDELISKMIREDEIDILVDLSGHTGGTSLSLFALKPAAIQVSMIGYPFSTGLPTMDYQITDNVLHPPGITEPMSTEKLVRLPGIFACYRPPDNAPAVGPLPALANGYVTFGYFNNLAKLRTPVLRAWAMILQRMPTAKIVIQTGALDDAYSKEYTLARCAEAGIPEKNIEIRGLSTLAKFHDDLNTIDIVLDPFPFNGHTTSCQILHMGVPIVTLAGHTRSGRMGASLLYNLGLRKLVAHSVEEYADIAVRLAGDLKGLAAIRAGLREKMETSPIMDAYRYVAELEEAYRKMVADAGGV